MARLETHVVGSPTCSQDNKLILLLCASLGQASWPDRQVHCTTDLALVCANVPCMFGRWQSTFTETKLPPALNDVSSTPRPAPRADVLWSQPEIMATLADGIRLS